MKNMKKTWQGQRFQHIGGSRIDQKTIKKIIEKSENRGVKKEAKKELCHPLTGGWRANDAGNVGPVGPWGAATTRAIEMI